MNYYLDGQFLVDLLGKLRMGDEIEIVVVVDIADDDCDHNTLLVKVMTHNDIHHNTYVVDTVVVVVDAHDDCIEHLVNSFALVDVFVFYSDDYHYY